MAGIIQNARKAPTDEVETPEQEAAEPPEQEASETPEQESAEHPDGQITPQSVRAGVKLPPEKMAMYEKVVAAGRKILYSPQMDEQIQKLLEGPGDLAQKLGEGVVLLLAILLSKSNGSIPGDLLIPAGIELVADAGDMLRKAGQKVTDKDVSRGTAVMIQDLMKRAGVSMDQLSQAAQSQAGAPPVSPDGAPTQVPPAPQGQA